MKRLALMLLLAGCARTEVVVSVSTKELTAPIDFDRILMTVTNPELDPTGTSPEFQSPPLTVCAPGQTSNCDPLPITLTLYPGSAQPNAKVKVEVAALLGESTQPLISQASVFTFTQGDSAKLDFQLFRQCLSVQCAQFDEACDASGTCASLAPSLPNAPADGSMGNNVPPQLLTATTLNVGSSVAQFDLPAPENLQAGDLLVLAMAAGVANDMDPAPVAPGWKVQTTTGQLTTRLLLLTHLAGPSEPASWTFATPNSSSVSVESVLVHLRGAGIVDGAAGVEEVPPYSLPSLTTTQSNDLFLSFTFNNGGLCPAPPGTTLAASDNYWSVASATLGPPGATGSRAVDCQTINPGAKVLLLETAIAPQ